MVIQPSSFKPAYGLANKHLQTILSSVGPRRFKLARIKQQLFQTGEAHTLTLNDNVRLLCYYNRAQNTASPSARSSSLVILIHGWEGSESSSYMLSAAATLLTHGHDVVRLNMRDHGDSHHLNEEAFNSTLLAEIIQAVEVIQARFNYRDTHLAGFSLGGNFCLRVAAAAHSHAISLRSTTAFCPVVHAELANAALVEPRNWLYNAYFVRKWKRSLRLKSAHFPHRYPVEQFAHLGSLDAMNRVLIPQYTAFSQLSDYFDAYAITGNRLANTICPCYLHFARDDMIIPVDSVEQITPSDNLHIVITEHGGHCGFLSSWRFESWQDERLLQIVNHYSQADE